jgi:hypothetical protein
MLSEANSLQQMRVLMRVTALKWQRFAILVGFITYAVED